MDVRQRRRMQELEGGREQESNRTNDEHRIGLKRGRKFEMVRASGAV